MCGEDLHAMHHSALVRSAGRNFDPSGDRDFCGKTVRRLHLGQKSIRTSTKLPLTGSVRRASVAPDAVLHLVCFNDLQADPIGI